MSYCVDEPESVRGKMYFVCVHTPTQVAGDSSAGVRADIIRRDRQRRQVRCLLTKNAHVTKMLP